MSVALVKGLSLVLNFIAYVAFKASRKCGCVCELVSESAPHNFIYESTGAMTRSSSRNTELCREKKRRAFQKPGLVWERNVAAFQAPLPTWSKKRRKLETTNLHPAKQQPYDRKRMETASSLCVAKKMGFQAGTRAKIWVTGPRGYDLQIRPSSSHQSRR